MATAAEYAAWIVNNQSKRGTPQFETVARAYEIAKQQQNQAAFEEQNQPVVREPGIVDELVGAGEAALTAATGVTGGTAGLIAGAGAGLAESILSGKFGTQEGNALVRQAAQEGAGALTYAPRTSVGQERAQQMAQFAQEVLPPVLPQIAAPGMALQATRQAAPIVSATGQRALAAGGAAVQQAGQRVGGAVQSAREAVGMAPDVQVTPQRQSIGAAATTGAAQRVATAESLPVPIRLTQGAATREAEQLAFEKEQMKGPLGAPLRSRAEENNLQAMQNMDALFDMTEAKAPDISATGNAVVRALSEGYKGAKNKVNIAYKKARESEESRAPVDTALPVQLGEEQLSLAGYLNSKPTGVPSSAVTDSVRKIAVKLGVASEDADGNLVAIPSTVGKMEEFRKEVSGVAKFDDAVGMRDETIIKRIIDGLTEPVSGPLYKEARRLRTEQARKYENRAIVARLVTNRRGMDDPQVAADQVFQRSILNASPEEITFLKRVLQTSGKNGQQAWKELQGATVRYIQDEATKGMGMDSQDRPIVSPAKLNQSINQLDQNGRLDIVFGKKNAQTIRDLNEVVRYVNTVPPGTLINSSGTAGALMGAIAEMGATGAMTGVPVPAISLIRAATRQMKDNKLKARINKSLDASM